MKTTWGEVRRAIEEARKPRKDPFAIDPPIHQECLDAVAAKAYAKFYAFMLTKNRMAWSNEAPEIYVQALPPDSDHVSACVDLWNDETRSHHQARLWFQFKLETTGPHMWMNLQSQTVVWRNTLGWSTKLGTPARGHHHSIVKFMDELYQEAMPPSTSGMWWADKETYELVRPMFDGEDMQVTPGVQYVAYNPTTGEEAK